MQSTEAMGSVKQGKTITFSVVVGYSRVDNQKQVVKLIKDTKNG